MNASQRASWSSVTHSFGWCACAMWPGPQITAGTEAALFHNAAVPAVICGPGHIAQAHQPNEWVALDQLARCEAFMERLADRLCTA